MSDYENRLCQIPPETMLAQFRADVDAAERIAKMRLLDGDAPATAISYIATEMRLDLETLEQWMALRAEPDRADQLAVFRARVEDLERRRVGSATTIGAWLIRRIARRSAPAGGGDR